jgi:hypothetical protein
MESASPIRPSKKPRLAPLGPPHEDLKIDKACCLGPLIQQFTFSNNLLSKNDSFENFLRKSTSLLALRTSKHINIGNDSLKMLHRILVLRLGFLIGPHSCNTEIDNEKLEILSLVMVCLQSILERGVDMILDPEESKETFSISLQTLCVLNNQPVSERDTAELRLHKLKADCCRLLQLLLHMYSTLREWLNRDRPQLEKLLFVLLSSVGGMNSRGNAEQNHVDQFLRIFMSSSFGSLPRKLARIAMKVRFNGGEGEKDSSLFSSITEDQIFYWKCLSQAYGQKHSPSCDFVKTLVETIQTPTHSCDTKKRSIQALECFNLIAMKLSDQDCLRTTKAIVGFILYHDSDRTTELNLALLCLELLMGRENGVELVLRLERSQELFEFLTNTAFDMRESDLAKLAGGILILMISSIAKNQRPPENLELRQCLAVISGLFSSETQTVVERSVQLVSEWSHDEKMRRRAIDLYPDLIPSLAKVASDDFAPKRIRRLAVMVFWNMVKDDTTRTNFLARQPNVLESLVSLASIRGSAEGRTSCRLAVATLLKLSKNACNRRILAKQPGLLSSMIRYTRTHLNDEEWNGNLSVRSDMKKQLILLASAL